MLPPRQDPQSIARHWHPVPSGSILSRTGPPERGVPRFSPSQPCLVCHTSVYLWVFYLAIVLQNEKSGVLIQRQTSRGGDFPLWGMDPQSGKGLVMALGEFEAALPGGERIVL